MDGVTALELGSFLFNRYSRSCNLKEPGCPFANGCAEFIGRNNDGYARKFCKDGCSPDCTWIMIEENRKRYDAACIKMKKE